MYRTSVTSKIYAVVHLLRKTECLITLCRRNLHFSSNIQETIFNFKRHLLNTRVKNISEKSDTIDYSLIKNRLKRYAFNVIKSDFCGPKEEFLWFLRFFQVDFNRLKVNAPLNSFKNFWSITIDLKNLKVRESIFYAEKNWTFITLKSRYFNRFLTIGLSIVIWLIPKVF